MAGLPFSISNIKTLFTVVLVLKELITDPAFKQLLGSLRGVVAMLETYAETTGTEIDDKVVDFLKLVLSMSDEEDAAPVE